jgi:hypothetical protein
MNIDEVEDSSVPSYIQGKTIITYTTSIDNHTPADASATTAGMLNLVTHGNQQLTEESLQILHQISLTTHA